MRKTLLILIAFMLSLTTTVALLADSEGRDDEEGYERHTLGQDNDNESWLRRLFGSAQASPIGSWRPDPGFGAYSSECGDCHTAYPPNMLPRESWNMLMANLDDHFGDNAELDTRTAAEIGAFLARHADGGMKGSKGSSGSWSTSDRRMHVRTPLRITDTPWFRAQHHEIPARMVENNPEIRSYSRCEACHTRAAEGSFDEHAVRIPGYGRWDD
jgi:hypothetical protein